MTSEDLDKMADAAFPLDLYEIRVNAKARAFARAVAAHALRWAADEIAMNHPGPLVECAKRLNDKAKALAPRQEAAVVSGSDFKEKFVCPHCGCNWFRTHVGDPNPGDIDTVECKNCRWVGHRSVCGLAAPDHYNTK